MLRLINVNQVRDFGVISLFVLLILSAVKTGNVPASREVRPLANALDVRSVI